MKKLLWAAAGLILIVNSTVLVRAFYNRLEPHQGQITLSERELPLAWRDFAVPENNSLALRLEWRTLHDEKRPVREPSWLTSKKYAELGITNTPADTWLAAEPQRDLYVVLEFNGPAYQSDLAQSRARLQAVAEDSEKSQRKRQSYQEALNYLEYRASRLYAIDAGLQLESLRSRYPESNRYLIVPGSIHLLKYWSDSSRPAAYLSLYADESLNLPYQLRQQWQAYKSQPTRYQVKLTLGRLLEPWLSDLSIEKQP